MIQQTDENEFPDRFDPMVDELHALGEQIDRRRYPGLAWQAARAKAASRRIRRIGWSMIAAASTAAAAVLLMAVLHLAGPPAPVPQTPVTPAGQPAKASEQLAGIWHVPTGIDLASASQVTAITMNTADVSVPGNAEIAPSADFQWSLPTFTIFPTE